MHVGYASMQKYAHACSIAIFVISLQLQVPVKSILLPSTDESPKRDVTKMLSDADRGCLSKQGECVTDLALCRTFSYSNVASIICQCTHLCSEIGLDADSSEKTFVLKCKQSRVARREVQQSLLPSFCQLIPFL